MSNSSQDPAQQAEKEIKNTTPKAQDEKGDEPPNQGDGRRN
ncbi:MAG: hypothetical protein ACM37W_19470 [Actinomycetota bacterium]